MCCCSALIHICDWSLPFTHRWDGKPSRLSIVWVCWTCFVVQDLVPAGSQWLMNREFRLYPTDRWMFLTHPYLLGSTETWYTLWFYSTSTDVWVVVFREWKLSSFCQGFCYSHQPHSHTPTHSSIHTSLSAPWNACGWWHWPGLLQRQTPAVKFRVTSESEVRSFSHISVMLHSRYSYYCVAWLAPLPLLSFQLSLQQGSVFVFPVSFCNSPLPLSVTLLPVFDCLFICVLVSCLV